MKGVQTRNIEFRVVFEYAVQRKLVNSFDYKIISVFLKRSFFYRRKISKIIFNIQICEEICRQIRMLSGDSEILSRMLWLLSVICQCDSNY